MPHTHNPPEGDRIVQICSDQHDLFALTSSGRVFQLKWPNWKPVPPLHAQKLDCQHCAGSGSFPDHPDGKCTYCHGAGWVNADPEPVTKEFAPLAPLPEVWAQSKLPTGEPGEMCLNCMGHGHKKGANCGVCGGTGIFTDSDL